MTKRAGFPIQPTIQAQQPHKHQCQTKEANSRVVQSQTKQIAKSKGLMSDPKSMLPWL